MKVSDYMPSIQQIREIGRRAEKGDRIAQQNLIALTNNYARVVNRNLSQLERTGYDFGAYTRMMGFLDAMFDTNRAQNAAQLKYDWGNMRLQSEHAAKFLSMKSSTVEGQRDAEAKRLYTLRHTKDGAGNPIIPENVSDRVVKNFLKFLGQEHSSLVVDIYGKSETIIEMMFDAYRKPNNSKKKMTKAFQEFLAHKITLGEAFEKLGIDTSMY